MGPPDTEWLLWAKRLHIEHFSLLQRLTAIEESAKQTQELVQENKEALDQIKALTKTISALKESNLDLEKDIVVLKRTAQRAQDELKHVNSEYQKSLTELDATNRRVLRLETAIDRITPDQIWEDLKRQLLDQNDRLMQRVNWWRSEAAAAHERPENRILSRKPNRRPVSKSLSQATTATVTVDTNDTEARAEDSMQEEVRGVSQGQLTLEEYFAYGMDLMGRARTIDEGKAVRAFVAGIRDEVSRIPLEKVLNEKAWTWEETTAEMERVIAHRQKNKRSKRYIVPPEEMEAYMKMAL